MIAIIDLDGCISDDRWRRHFIDEAAGNPDDKYKQYHAACGKDTPANLAVVRSLARRYTIVVFTARPIEHKEVTWEWLHKHNVPAQAMYMRPTGNHMTSVDLKQQMLLQLDEHVQFAIDDRSDVLEMYANNGVPICQRIFIPQEEVRADNAEQDS